MNRDCLRSPQIIYYDHVENQREKFDLSVLKSTDGKLFVSWSTATTAIHLAYWMGAKNIILVGHDCGQINGKTHIEGYAERKDGSVDAWRGNEQQYIKWLSKIEAQTISLRNFLKQEFGVNVYSINPFVSLSLEGATFTRS